MTVRAATRRPATDVDWRRAWNWGLLGGLTLVFICAIGMPETFDRRLIVDPWMSMGYLSLLWVPIAVGFVAAAEETLDGVAPPQKGARDVLAGLVAGSIGGLCLGIFILVIDTWDLRDIFPKLGPALVDLLTFGRGDAVGALIWIVACAVLGAFGGLLQVLPRRVRSAIGWALALPLTVAFLEIAVQDLLQSLSLEGVIDFIYAINGGLTTAGFFLLAVVGAVIGMRSKGSGVSRFRLHYASLEGDARRRWNLIAGVIVIAAIAILPTFLGSLTNELLANVGLFLLMALGLNIVVGFAGLLDLGYVAFFAVGAYTTAVLTSPLSPKYAPMFTLDFLSIEGWIVVGSVLSVAVIAGIVVGTPVIKMRGDYLAIVTLGFGEIVRVLFLSDWLAPIFGGAQGIRQIPSAGLGPVEIRGTNSQSIFYLVAVFAGIAVYVSWRLLGSRIGRAWAALREDEKVAEAMGINTVSSKLFAFVCGAILASFAGMVFAVKVGSVFPNSFELLVSVIVLVIVIVGGMGSIPGVIVGAVVLIGILGGPTQPGVLQEFAEYKLLIYGAVLVFMMLRRPEGLWPSVRRQRELHQEEFLQDAWLKQKEQDAAKVRVLDGDA
jgi:branched-chain amino acid transport system permease protein